MELKGAELLRRIENLVRPGTIAEVDYPGARVRVKVGDLTTDWLPWSCQRAGGDRDWWPPETGEQVAVLAVSADPAQGIVLPALYQGAKPAPGDRADLRITVFADGAELSYDRRAHHLTIDLPGNATLAITAQGGITIEAKAGITIDASGGDVVVKGDVIADGISLKTHVHGGVEPGGGVSGPPR